MGRNFYCDDEVVIYFCRSTGGALLVSAPFVFLHAFTSSAPVPDIMTFSNISLILRSGAPIYEADALVTMTNKQVNITCSSGVPGSEEVLPLIRECKRMPACLILTTYNFVFSPLWGNCLVIFYAAQIVPPSAVTCQELTGRLAMNVSWSAPENPQFDVDYFIVRSFRKGEIFTMTQTTRDESLLVEISGETFAEVQTVSACGTISSAQQCDLVSVEIECMFYQE